MHAHDSVPARLKVVRELLGYTQKGVAEAVGGKLRSWQDYERGLKMPGGSVFQGLAKLGINVNWLLTGEGPMRIDDVPARKTAAEPRELLVAQVAKTVDYALDDMNLELDLDKKWELIELIADMEADTGSHVDRKHVVRLVRSAA